MRRAMTMLMLPLAFLLASCGPYQMKGRVVEGDISFIAIVDADDVRFQNQPVEGVLLRARVDPGRVSGKTVAQETSDADGNFSLPVDEFGAGVVDMDVEVLARRSGYKSAESVFNLPRDGKRVLIMMAPGRDPPGWGYDRETVEDTLRRYDTGAESIEDEVRRYR